MAVPRQPQAPHPTARLLGASPAIVALRTQLQHLARFDAPGHPAVPTLLLQGETGTGKGLLARVAHDSGPRAAAPFLAVNCAALPDTLLEAELFGFEAGAFTDAKRAKPGLFEAASGGTLFLDEIDALPLALQGKLLTALDTKRVRRLGAVAEHPVDVKLIAATNADLGQRITTGQFRADLYHRLAVVVLTLPPLRERADDVVLLAQTLLDQLAAAHGLPPKRLQAEALQWLQHYAWPGNVRELQHVLERVTLLHTGERITAPTLEQWCLVAPGGAAPPPPAPPGPEVTAPVLPEAAAQIAQTLVRTGGNLAQAARLLGISRDQLRVRMRRYGVTRPAFPAPAMPPVASPPPTDVATSSAVQEEAAPVPTVPAPVVLPPGVERRHLTVLQCQLAYASDQSDLEGEAALLHVAYQVCEEVVARFGGYLAQYLPAGIVAYFGYPQAREDDAVRAVRAALALREAVQRLASPDGAPVLEVCLGLHTGLLAIQASAPGADQARVAMGEALLLTAQIQALARPGTVLCSAVTARLVAGYMRLEALETSARHGRDVPQPVYRVVGDTGARNRLEAAQARPLTPLVGRDPELALLYERWRQVQHSLGQVVLVWGEAGIGKSRLVQVLREQMIGDEAFQIVCQGTPEQQQSPLAPVIQSLQQVLGWRPGTVPTGAVQALEQAMEALGLPLHECVPPLAALLSLPLPRRYPPEALTPEQQKQRTLAALLRWLVQQAAQQPVLLMIEDLHWIDASTQELLDRLLEQVPTVPVYVLGTCRPEYALAWPPRTYCTQMTLTRLAPEQVAMMVTAVAGATPLPPAAVERIVQQTDGIPLFIEEVTKMVLEAAPLASPQAPDALQPPAAPLAIPATLQESLMARLDRLGSAKDVAQLGATLGRQFPHALLRAVAPHDDAALSQELARLQEAELLYQHGLPPHVTYRFKHALIQEAAYHSLSLPRRQHYHRQAAQALSAEMPALVASQPEILAQHYSAAGMAEPAVEAWLQAGQQAAARAAYVEAAAHCTRGLALLQTLPERPERHSQALSFYLTLGAALQTIKGYMADEVKEVYAQAQALCQRLPEYPQLSDILFHMWVLYIARGEHRTAQEIGLHILRLAQYLDDGLIRLRAYGALGLSALYLGEFVDARSYAEEGFTLVAARAQETQGVFASAGDLRLVYCLMGAWALQHLGFPQQASRWGQEVLDQAQTYALVFDRCNAQFFLALVYCFRREWAMAQRQSETTLELATTQGFPFYMSLSAVVCGAARGAQERAPESLEQIRQALATYQVLGARGLRPWGLAMFAETAGRLGQPESGLAALDEAQALMATTEERFYAAEIARLQGALLLQAGREATAAETCFQQALEIARGQQAKWWELRAAVSLARLWQQQGKRAEARQLLGDVYGWFTEGFDLADLREARDVLQALA